jgi:uncharacterized protein YndB with AHSA1/START domain
MSREPGFWTRVGSGVDTLIETVAGPAPEQQRPQRPGRPYPLGILFVHGMGEQERGDTITHMGDALTEWLRRYLGHDGFRLQDATLRSREGVAAGTTSHANSGRANATVILGEHENAQEPPEQWLLAESWWADAFRPASFGELAAWAIGVGPWLIASQASGLEQRLVRPGRSIVRRVFDGFVFVLLMVIAGLVAAVITPLAIALLLLSLIPIPFVSAFAQRIARNLAGSFGDLLVFVRSPVRFAAMAERVRQDVEWLDTECDRIMVVAHSQGSAVAWHAIRRTAQQQEGQRARVELFLTFGQAFRKLKSLHRLHTRVGGDRQFGFAALATASTLFLLIAAVQGIAVVGTLIAVGGDLGDLWDAAAPSVVAVAGSVAAVSVIQRILSDFADSNDRRAQDLILDDLEEVRSSLAGFRWLDLWASADPAPNGPLFTKGAARVASYRIRNVASTALDHSVYWSNVTEFVSAVAFAASSLTPGGPLGSHPIPVALQQASRVREARVTALACARVLVLAAFAATAVGLGSDLPGIGATILAFVADIPLMPDWFSGWPAPAQAAVAILALAAVALAGWWVLTWAWHAVVRTDEYAFFGSRPQIMWTPWAVAWAVVAGIVPTAVIGWLAWSRGDFTFVVVYLVVALIGLLVVARLLATDEPRLWPSSAYGRLRQANGRWELVFERWLRHPPERIWEALTSEEVLAGWFPPTTEEDLRPDASRVVATEPPRVLEFTWRGDGLQFMLEPHGEVTRMTLVDVLADRAKASSVAAEWHMALDKLETRLDDGAAADPATWNPLQQTYAARFGRKGAG